MKFKIKLPRRTGPQKRLDQSTKRFTLSLWGRQSGKTTGGYSKLFWKPLLGPRFVVYWHVLQTYSAARIVFRRYLRMIRPFRKFLLKNVNRTELSVELIGGRTIFFKSGHNFEDLRTESLAGVVIDEARQQRKELWTQVIYPMLAKSKGWADIMSSPNGYDWLYDLKNEKEKDPSWEVIHAPSTDAWWWDQAEIDEAKKNMSDLEFRQEIMAEFVNLRSGKVYYAFTDANKRETCPFVDTRLWSPYHPVILGLDFNVNPMAWVLGQFVYDQWWFFDEIRLTNSNTPEASDALVTKILAMKEAGFNPADHDVILCGDASGNARSTRTSTAKSNESDYVIIAQKLKAAGIRFRNVTPAANPSIKDRVNAFNAKCKSASGAITLFVHPINCKWLVHDCERVVWKEGADFILDPGKDKMLTHPSDAAGYPVAYFSPVKVSSGKTRMQVMPRTL